VQGDKPATEPSTTSSLQPTTAPEHINPTSRVELPPATGGSTSAAPPAQPQHLCVTVVAHVMLGGGFRECGSPNPSLVAIFGIGDGATVSADRQDANEQPTPAIDAEVSGDDGIGSGGVSADVPLHGAPSVGGNLGLLEFGPEGTITRKDGRLATDFGLTGPIPTGKETQKTSQPGEHGVSANASIDGEVPISWRYVRLDTLMPPVSQHMFFGF
jgi:hypothetical protein